MLEQLGNKIRSELFRIGANNVSFEIDTDPTNKENRVRFYLSSDPFKQFYAPTKGIIKRLKSLPNNVGDVAFFKV